MPEVVGRAVRRVDIADKVTGRQRFLTDRSWPGDVWARVVRSPHPKAKLIELKIDAPGVLGVFLPEDVPAGRFNPALAPDTPQLRAASDKKLLTRVAQHVGDGVALVLAEDAVSAERAVAAAEASWEVREALMTIDAALAGGAVLGRMGFGDDVERPLREAAVVVDERFEVAGAHHVCLETHSCRAVPTPHGVEIWSNTQSPGELRHLVALVLSLAEADVRVRKVDEGGGFGLRQDMYEEALVAWAARELGRPVRLIYDRAEEFRATRRRHGMRADVKLGADATGLVTALDVRAVVDSGAYGSHAPYVANAIALAGRTMYPRAAHHFSGEVVRTNTLPGGAYRGYGVAQLGFAVETAVTGAARRLGIDQVELRCRNAHPRLRECLERGREAFGWPRRAERSADVLRGHGVAIAVKSTVTGEDSEFSQARVEFRKDGGATLITGTCDSGTGSSTVLAQVVAQELGIPVEAVRVVEGDTAVTPADVGSAAQRSVFLGAGAARKAARAVRAGFRDPVVFRADRAPASYCACFVGVAVDLAIGTVTVEDCLMVTDCGRVLNPAGAAGQVQGGVAQGIGLALVDHCPPEGVTTIHAHGVPTSLDVPDVQALFVDRPVDAAPYGGLGLGELPIVPVPAAVAGAIADATGVLPTSIPLRPDVVWGLLAGAGR
ncbi:xanthine dehydrogenase family protein molybdopterin-binding subunit [Amycolatopsis sp. CA-128772]|uniref:xanthine dehydrogenase family protein molybdopterin-binding subunit n=1 Tax=Amycolatopsis sp. CA-128772 TaxID=2073159 RepID=UPI000CD27E29|nr:xanthine dehydrogenase family protein molybdopterin-binding subunit [Amycolatopsis sp. CA-128772]